MGQAQPVRVISDDELADRCRPLFPELDRGGGFWDDVEELHAFPRDFALVMQGI